MLARPQPQFGQHRAQLGGVLAGEQSAGSRAVARQQVGRQIELAARGMQRQRAQQAGERIGDAGVAGSIADVRDRGRRIRMRAASSISAEEVCAA